MTEKQRTVEVLRVAVSCARKALKFHTAQRSRIQGHNECCRRGIHGEHDRSELYGCGSSRIRRDWRRLKTAWYCMKRSIPGAQTKSWMFMISETFSFLPWRWDIMLDLKVDSWSSSRGNASYRASLTKLSRMAATIVISWLSRNIWFDNEQRGAGTANSPDWKSGTAWPVSW